MSDKMTRPLTNDFNAITGKYTSREMNDNELAQYEGDIALELSARQVEGDAAKANAEAKASAANKLAALGLDADDLRALGL